MREQIAAYDVMLVIIGTQWASIMQERAGRADDFVRVEIENALSMKKLIVPVLVMEAKMPDFSQLPPSIADLQWRNAATVRRNPDLVNDCERIANGVQDSLQSLSSKPVETPKTHIGEAFAPFAIPTMPVKINTDKTKELLPAPFDWCPIPAGKVTLITEKARIKNYIPEGQNQTFDVLAFEMAKYPVTNAQYAKFIESGGYKTKDWWTEDGWKVCQEGWHYDGGWKASGKAWTEPRYWQDSKWNGAHQPVLGVSWYESIAFCMWLSNLTGNKILLPTEQQWQRAAQAKPDGGDTGWVYVWGNDWDGKKCNNSMGENNSQQTTIVTHYEKLGNVSPCGVVDLIGNVWEWCLTEYETGKLNIYGTGVRVLRGGSWVAFNAEYFRCAFRFGYYPHFWNNFGGFRLSRS